MPDKQVEETIAEVDSLTKTDARVRELERKLEQARRERDAEKLVNRELELLVRDARLSNFKIPTQKSQTRKSGSSYVRVAFGDTHGASIDIPAWQAFLRDMERLNPKVIVHGGDIVDCGGWLAEHHTMNYLPETNYSYFDDISAANQMWDQLQEVCPEAEIHAIQGNHDVRPERWCIQQTRRHRVDAERLASLVTPEVLMHLDKRGINWYRRDTHYHGLAGNKGSIRLGKCCFTHPQRSSKHHASKMASSWGANVVYFHTHRRDYYPAQNSRGEEWGAWNPGCMCHLRKPYQHSENWEHSHGYHLQYVSEDGTFFPMNVQISNGHSFLGDFIEALK